MGVPTGATSGVAELWAGGAPEGKPVRVLLAEDHVINQRLVEAILGRWE
jgi:hypothetical protein